MNVLFVYPLAPPRYEVFGIQQGLASLSAVLKAAGHRTRLYCHHELNRDELDAVVESFRPGLVGMYVTYPQSDLAHAMASHLFRRHKLPIVLGGVWPTTCAEDAIAWSEILGIGLGDSEHALQELVDALEAGRAFEGLPGFWFRHDGRVQRNPPAPYVDHLDSLPLPDRSIFDGQRFMNQLPYLEFIGQRGCPFGCTNCYHHAWRRSLTGNRGYVRFKSPSRLVEEIKDAIATYPKPGRQCLGFHDPTFTIRKSWALEVCELMAKEVGVPWWCNTRASHLDEEMVAALQRGGCYEVHMGIESGDDYIRNQVLRKRVSEEDLLRAFRLTREYGLRTFGFNMIGLPHETERAILKTVELNRRLQPDTLFCSVFNPYPGTDLYTMARENGWLSDRKVRSYFEHTSVLNQPSVTPETVSHYHKFFRLMVRHPLMASVLRPLDRIRLDGGPSLYDGLDRVFGQSSHLRKQATRLLSPDLKHRIKKLLHI